MDKRPFHNYLNKLKDENPNDFTLIESIQDHFETNVDCITDDQRKAIRNYPIQFIERIPQEDGGWTTNLHIWGENGVEELLDLDPMILTHKNGYGDSILMSMIVGATGAHTEVVNHKLIQKILEKDLAYDDIEMVDGNEEISPRNVLDITDLNGQTILDYLIDFAYATGNYKGQEPDEKLQMLLQYFSECNKNEPETENEEPETVVVVNEKPSTPQVVESTEDDNKNPNELNESLDIKRYVSENSSSTMSSTIS